MRTRSRRSKAMRARKGRWLFFIDIAVPRDVEPEVGELENVYLYDVDALEQVVAQNRAARASEAAEAEAMVDAELKRYHEHELSLGAVPTIKLLRARFLEVALAEVERIGGAQLGDKDRAAMQAMAEAIVNKLLHVPLTKLKKDAARASRQRAAGAGARAVRSAHRPHRGDPRRPRRDLPIRARRRRNERGDDSRSPRAARRWRCGRPTGARPADGGRSAPRRRAAGAQDARRQDPRSRALARSAARGCSSRRSRRRCSTGAPTSRCTR